jgi:hypothetical protein
MSRWGTVHLIIWGKQSREVQNQSYNYWDELKSSKWVVMVFKKRRNCGGGRAYTDLQHYSPLNDFCEISWEGIITLCSNNKSIKLTIIYSGNISQTSGASGFLPPVLHTALQRCSPWKQQRFVLKPKQWTQMEAEHITITNANTSCLNWSRAYN